MEPFACVLLVCIWFAVNGSIRRYAVQHPAAQGAQMAYAASQWLIWVVILWWVVFLTPKLTDHYLPDDVLIDVEEWRRSNETTSEFLFPLLPSWSDKK